MPRLLIVFFGVLALYTGFGQKILLADSITIIPALKEGALKDVFLSGGHLRCRFDEWNEFDKIVELKNIISDVPFPQGMHTFIGYQVGKYYFRTRENKKTTKSSMVKIYEYSLMPEVPQ